MSRFAFFIKYYIKNKVSIKFLKKTEYLSNLIIDYFIKKHNIDKEKFLTSVIEEAKNIEKDIDDEIIKNSAKNVIKIVNNRLKKEEENGQR